MLAKLASDAAHWPVRPHQDCRHGGYDLEERDWAPTVSQMMPSRLTSRSYTYPACVMVSTGANEGRGRSSVEQRPCVESEELPLRGLEERLPG